MFSFHKPKVYRSPTGCCICRAKSSSSRFTDSKKYEDDFMECFQLIERRTGEICNACVLLVKRWKKLPDGCERNWRHVVDARAGPGTKSLTKFKSRNKKKLKLKAEKSLKMETLVKKKHVYIRGSDRSVREESPGACSDDIMGEDFMSDLSGPSVPSSLAPSPTPFDNAACANDGKSKSPSPVGFADDDEDDEKPAVEDEPQISSFLDPTYWKSEKVCCGTIFVGARGEAAVDPRFLKACVACLRLRREATAAGVASVADTAAQSAPAKSFSDSSSDSGYDESSNPSTGAETLVQFARHAAGAAVERCTPRQSSPTTAN